MSRRRRSGLRCPDVRPLLPELAEGTLHEAGPVEAHIAVCPDCSAELTRYRVLIEAMAELRVVTLEPAPELVDRLLTGIEPETHRVPRLHRVVLSVGGAVVGATAVGLLWWRTARRGLPSAAGAAGSLLASS
jgi:anti-sigma factor RsiW